MKLVHLAAARLSELMTKENDEQPEATRIKDVRLNCIYRRVA